MPRTASRSSSSPRGSVRRAAPRPQRTGEKAAAVADLATARKIVLDLLAIPGVSGD